MSQDYYEILQVHPRADGDAIRAAYQRLRERYDPARLDGAADELVDLARQKRDQIERAYAVLSDPLRRDAYDREQAALAPAQAAGRKPQAAEDQAASIHPAPAADQETQETPLDYRPLPPARRAERARGFDAQPTLAKSPRGRAATRRVDRMGAPVALAGLLALAAAIALLITQSGAPAPAASAVTPTPSILDQFEALIPQAKSAAEQRSGDPQAWIDYGDMLYNSAEIVRENAPDSPIYQQRLPRWIEATEAYSRALALQPNNPGVRADMGASSCFYGVGVGDQRYVRDGAEATRQAASEAPNDARVLLSLGHCLVSVQPPQTEEAVASWRKVVQLSAPDSPLAAQAQGLIARYSQ